LFSLHENDTISQSSTACIVVFRSFVKEDTMSTPTDTAASVARSLIDIDRYPVDDLTSPAGRNLVERCRTELQAGGACQLEGFLRDDAIASLSAEAAALSDGAFTNTAVHNAYFEDVDESLPEDDARRIMQRASQATVAYDMVPADAGIRALYEWDPLLEFVGAALGKSPFYRNADPLGAMNLVYYGEGDELGWHFDRAEFVVTLMLQPAESGGDFEYGPNLRSDENEDYPRVARLLQGDPTDVIHLPSQAGVLAFFRGRHSIHRVTPIKGDILRTNAVLSYSDRPDHRLNELTQKMFYGRTA
jgi:hypothetical protein